MVKLLNSLQSESPKPKGAIVYLSCLLISVVVFLLFAMEESTLTNVIFGSIILYVYFYIGHMATILSAKILQKEFPLKGVVELIFMILGIVLLPVWLILYYTVITIDDKINL